MSAQHTQGKLIYWSCRVDSRTTPPMYDYLQFAAIPKKEHVFRAPIQFVTEANARRLVACWNAMEKVDTEVLESLTRPGDVSWALAINELAKERDELLEQREELMSVLRNFTITGPDDDGLIWLLMHGSGTTGSAMFNLGAPRLISGQVALLLEQDRRAAIAKVTGSPT